jgi:hypothetical protein
MSRLRDAVREWLELRRRVREEREFHFERIVEDLIALGASRREARRNARRRLGGRRNLRLGLREIGGNVWGLVRLLRANRALASAWLQPGVLTILCIFILLAGGTRMFRARGPEVVQGGVLFLADHGPYPRAVSDADFDALQGMHTVIRVERERNILARAEAAPGATMEAIHAEVRTRTGHDLRIKEFDPGDNASPIPVAALWVVISCWAGYWLRRAGTHSLVYGSSVLALHALLSVLAWMYGNQLWERLKPESNIVADVVYGALMAAFLVAAAAQVYVWRRDLLRRCPQCLERLVLPLSAGDPNSFVLNPATTESICAQGHGVLVESRLSTRFRPSAATIESLFRSL